eukprot:NODE_42_length_34079_cov_0.552619.p14 type:complete len:176 gc:universal NODE_42_length_34079_cov_0.552619:7178-6651(-)
MKDGMVSFAKLGVPFIIRAGKALNESKQEIRIQFKDVPCNIFEGSTLSRNELVIRLQPNPCVYLKIMNKKPGTMNFSTEISELDLSYSQKFKEHRIPEAYESLFLDALAHNQSNFVRSDELDESWRIFSPILHQIENSRLEPAKYAAGSRGPPNLDEFLDRFGVKRDRTSYNWKK